MTFLHILRQKHTIYIFLNYLSSPILRRLHQTLRLKLSLGQYINLWIQMLYVLYSLRLGSAGKRLVFALNRLYPY